MEHSTKTPDETEEDEILEDLPSLPQVIPEILALQDGDPIDRLIELIEQDAPLAIKVLSTCNSPALGLRREVTTVGDAVVGLGLRAVRSLAICTAVVEAVADRNGGLSEVAQAHKAALRRAGTARALAHVAKVSTPQEAFTAGLLADIGRFWLARRYPDGQEACRTLIGSGEDPVAVERELFGEDHIELGVRVAEGWNLPERLKRVIRLHHQEEQCTEVLEQIVHLSDLAATLQESAIQESGDQRRLRDLAWTWFGLESKQLEGWLEQAGRDAKDAADALDLPAPPPPVRKISELCRELGAMYVDNERMVRELRASVRQAQQYSSQLKQQMAKLDVMATTDDLTGIGNRRAIRERLEEEMIQATEENQTAILLIDLDKFKHINDTYGHEGGDQALKSLSRFLQRVTRGSDFVGRYGGDEFIVILPGADCVGAQVVAERIRKVVAETKVPLRDGRKLQMQVSIGGCTLPIPDTEEEAAIALVDRALYAAKRLGRNQVVWVGAEDGSTPAVKPPERSRRKWEPPRKKRPTKAA